MSFATLDILEDFASATRARSRLRLMDGDGFHVEHIGFEKMQAWWASLSPELRRVIKGRWRRLNRDACRAHSLDYYHRCKNRPDFATKRKERNRAYGAANRHKINARRRALRAERPEPAAAIAKRAEYQRAYRAANAERLRAYFAANKDRINGQRRARALARRSA